MRKAGCQCAPWQLYQLHSLHSLWPMQHTPMLGAENHYRRYVCLSAPAGMRFPSGNWELIKIPFVNVKAA